MPLLPAQIPDIPETRAEIVPARLARKVGPLFGVPWDRSPFGHRTWVSDHSRITLSEIARGAPLPTRAQSAQLPPTEDGTWRLHDRVGLTGPGAALPNEIANATLNRFGPDTRSAVLLTATNRLLDPVRRGIDASVALLVDHDGGPLSAELRLAAWAALVVETFRSQPALVAAGMSARAVQRELVAAWELPRSPRLAGTPLTRCEISAPDRAGSPSRPCDLDVADATFAALHPDTTHGRTLAQRLRHDEIVDRLLRSLRAAGTLQDASHLWLSERRDGEVVVEAMVPPTRLVQDFLAQVTEPEPGPDRLPRVPGAATVRSLPVLGRRALLIGLLAVLRHVQSVPERRERTRDDVVAALTSIAALAADVLPVDDPAAVVVRCRTALMTVQTLRHDTANDLGGPVRDLLDGVDRCAAALDAGVLDRGAAAEIIGAANIEVNIVRRTRALDTDGGLPAPDDLDHWLHTRWNTYLTALEVTPEDLAEPDAERLGMIGYHLHNYAAFLTWHPDSPAHLAAAARLFRDVVLPARERFRAGGGGFEPLRHSLQVATRATGALATAAIAGGDAAGARAWAGQGLVWTRRALADPSTEELLAGATEPASRLALLAAPALLLAVELGVPGAGRTDVDTAAALVDVARRWERRAVRRADTHARHAEVVDLERTIEKHRSGSDGDDRPEPA